MSQLQMEHTAIDALKPFERNARTHSPKQIQQIARSIEQFVPSVVVTYRYS